MCDRFTRTKSLIGKEALEKLEKSSVAVFGAGGVGSYCIEALARAGVGRLIIVDSDTINESNINRQLHALTDTIGMFKTLAEKDRILKINPGAKVETYEIFYLKDTENLINLSGVDYIVDAIDTVTAKLLLIERAKRENIKIISSMGTGNKLDNTAFKIADIYDTKICPLCKVMRKELKDRNIDSLKVVYSEEVPNKAESVADKIKRDAPASISFVPSVAGLIIAGAVINELIKI